MQTKHLRMLLLIVIAVVVGACGAVVTTPQPATVSAPLATAYINGITSTARTERETASAQALTDSPPVTFTSVPTSTADSAQLTQTANSNFETIVSLAATITSQGSVLIITATPIAPYEPPFTPTLCAAIVNCPTSTAAQGVQNDAQILMDATLSANVPTWTNIPSNTPEPALIIITVTADPNVPTWTPYPTWTNHPPFTPYPTLTPCPTGDPCAILDDDQLRATQIVEGATATQRYILTATSQALTITPLLDPDRMRATQIIAGATSTAEANQAIAQQTFAAFTPIPTFTAVELETMRARWINELETAVGFSHSALDAVINGLIESVTNINAGYVRDFHLEPVVVRTEYEGSTYIAVITRTSFVWADYSNLLLFRVIDDVVVLLPDVLDMNGIVFSFDGVRFSSREYLGGFADRNGNGYLEIAVDTDGGGSCGVQTLYLLEIRSDNQVVNLIAPPYFDRNEMVRNLVDVDDDGLMELEVLTYPGSLIGYGCHSLMMPLYYAWTGNGYENISSTLDESFYPAIGEFWANIDNDAICLLPDNSMYQMLIGYLALDRIEEGWSRLQPLLHWDLCSAEVRANEFTEDNMLNLVIWVTSLLPESTPTP